MAGTAGGAAPTCRKGGPAWTLMCSQEAQKPRGPARTLTCSREAQRIGRGTLRGAQRSCGRARLSTELPSGALPCVVGRLLPSRADARMRPSDALRCRKRKPLIRASAREGRKWKVLFL